MKIKELKAQLAKAHEAAALATVGAGPDSAGSDAGSIRPEAEIAVHGGAEGTLDFRLLSDGPWQKGFFTHDKAKGALLLFPGAF